MSQGVSSVLGCKVNIISRARIRYEGLLIAVDAEKPDDPVITLSQVISHGTEERSTDRYVPPKQTSYERITFRGRDLEDISLAAPDKEDILNDDPSILSLDPPSQLPAAIGTPKPTHPSSNSNTPYSNIGGELSSIKSINKSPGSSVNTPSYEFSDNSRGQKTKSSSNNSRGGIQNRSYTTNNQRGGYNNNYENRYNNRGSSQQNRYRGHSNHYQRPQNRNRNDKAHFDSEYDLEEANKVLAAELEKLELKHDEIESDRNGPESSGKSNSSVADFFDNLSCEIIDKANGVQSQPTNRRNERELNADTFGSSAFYDNRRGFSSGVYNNRGRGNFNRRPYGGFRGGARHNQGNYQLNGNWRRPNNYRQSFQNSGVDEPLNSFASG